MKLKFFLRRYLYLFERILLPYHCILCCGASDQRRDLCHQCQLELPQPLYTCLQCGIDLPNSDQKRCGQCLQHTPFFDSTIVGFNYQTPIDHWLKKFKFHKQGLYGRILAEVYAEKLIGILTQDPTQKPQVLLPMPLHWRRIAQRGFNQAYIITQYLSRHLHIPILKSCCVIRNKHTAAQSRLKQHARQRNVHGVFQVKNVDGIQHIAIIDDIMTTGNTMNELSRQLKLHGVQRVSVWALARVRVEKMGIA